MKNETNDVKILKSVELGSYAGVLMAGWFHSQTKKSTVMTNTEKYTKLHI